MNRKTSSFSRVLALLTALLPAFSSAFAFDLYWSEQVGENGVVMGADIDGGNATVVFDGVGMASGAVIVDIATTGTHVYWTENVGSSSAGGVWRAGLDGSGAAVFVPAGGGLTQPHFLAIDETNGHLYITDFSGGLFRADLADGGNLMTVVDGTDAGTPETFTGIAFRDANSLLFFSSADNALYEVGLGEFPWWMELSGFSLPGSEATYGMAFDPDTGTLYYTDFDGGTLRSFRPDAREAGFLLSGLSEPLGVKLSPSKNHLLVAERGGGVLVYQIDNGASDRLVESANAHFGVAVTADPAELPDPPPPAVPYSFKADFEEDNPGAAPATEAAGGVWATVSTPGDGTALVMEDVDDEFGLGTDNRFLRVESARAFSLITPTFEPLGVLTLSFDFIGRFNEADSSRWLNINIRAGSARAHITSPVMSSATVRRSDQANLSYGDNDVPVRMNTIVNNSASTITYDTPDGGTAELAPARASLWLFHYTTGTWEQLYEEYVYVRNLGLFGEVMDNIWFQLDTGSALRSFDIDNIFVFDGAHVGGPLFPPAAGFAQWLEEHFDEAERGDPSISGSGADPDGDGVANLLEYALGLDPRAASRDGFPAAGVGTFDEETYLSLVFRRPAAGREDIVYTVETAGEVGDWDGEAVFVSADDQGDGTELITYRDSQPFGTGARRFMHLKVEMAQ